jgi:hypothetical protein
MNKNFTSLRFPGYALLLTASFLFTSLFVSAQTMQWGWAKSLNGTRVESFQRVVADSRNGVYVLGISNSTTATAGNTILSNPVPGKFSYFLIKYDTLGTILWSKVIASTNAQDPTYQNTANVLVTDINSNVLMAIAFSNTITVGGNSYTSSGGTDILIMKMSATGNLLWIRQCTGSSAEYPNAINADASGNIYLAGEYRSSSFTIDTISVTLPPAVSRNLFYTKLNPGGNVIWAKTAIKGDQANFYYVSPEMNNRITLAGSMNGNSNFSPSSGIGLTTLYTSPFMIQIDANGNCISQMTTNTVVRDQGRSARVVGNKFLQTSSSTFLNAPGSISWSKYIDLSTGASASSTINGGVSNYPNTNFLNDIIADRNDNIYAIGQNVGANTYAGGFVLNSGTMPQSDFLIQRFNSNLVTQELMPSLNQTDFFKNLSAAAVDTFTNTLYVAGYFGTNTSRDTMIVGGNLLPIVNGISQETEGFVAQVRLNGPTVAMPLAVHAGIDRSTCANVPVSIGVTAANGSAQGASGGTPPYTYAWSPANVLANAASLTTMATISTDMMFVLTATDALGAIARDTIQVTVHPTPAAPTLSASGATTFCAGGSVTLSSSAGNGYIWSTGATSSSIAVTNSGQYSVRVSNANGCISAASAPIAVTVNPLPATPVISTSGPTTFCAGGSVTLSSSTGSGYIWSTGATTSSITVNSGGIYSVRVSDANGCTSLVSMPIAVTVNAVPAPPIITASGPTAFCGGGSVTLTSTGGNSFIWSTGANTPSITVSDAGQYSVQTTFTNGCISPASAPVTVTVNPVPAAPVISTSGPATFCAGGSVTLTSSISSSYLWSNGATTQSISVNTAGNYTVQVTNAAGCLSTASAPVVVTVNPLPPRPVITASGPVTFCAGGSVVLTANPVSPFYVWSNGALTQSITVSISGSMTVRAVTAAGCISDPSLPVNVLAIEAPPVPVITQVGNTLTTSPAAGYQWYYNGNLIPGATQQSYTYTTGGVFTVTVTNSNGCSSSSSPYTGARMVGSGLRNGQILYHQVYPNPVNDRATIAYDLVAPAEVSVMIVNNRGERVEIIVDRRQQNAGRYQLAVSRNRNAWIGGIYYVVFVINGERVTQPITFL